ncbi:MAG: hypothetical protein JRE64_01565 [Deltaproteobacteria bacterium]|nr:hypothetical protein [Deltaproteobacteria bacterium]
MMKKHSLYLDLGTAGIRLNFSCSRFAAQARQHIFLSQDSNGRTVGSIEYIEDNSVSRMIRVSCKPNVVHIAKEDLGKGHQTILLRMFDKFTIALDVQEDRVTVRYPSDAPIRLMLDDVLQAALQPILDRQGGFILHGSCMVNKGIAIVFMGNSGSGKSTTAFNLIRFGFHCYADDAVVVTSVVDALWVWPLAREFSIRPLSFRLFREHGVRIGDYKKDGEKYYFSQGSGKYHGAILKHICFVEVSGEAETVISYLNPEETLQILLQENRHFSFMGRQSARVYSKILAEKVPMPLKACVGMNLDSQGSALKDVVIGYVPPSAGKRLAIRNFDVGRKQKMALVRRAWSNAGHEPLEELIALLGDFDLKMFTLALSFFQTYPPAHIEPVEAPFFNGIIPQKFEASWLRAANWVEGCRKLLLLTSVEVLECFALAWIKSAPFIYPFLKVLTSLDPKKSEQVEKAWNLYTGENAKSDNNDSKRIEIHLSNFQNVFARSNPVFQDWCSSLFSSESEISHIYCWITQGEHLGKKDMQALFFKTIGKISMLTVVPVGLNNKDIFTTPIEFVRFALECGLRPKISRFTPLCRLGDEDAHFLLNAGAFERRTREGEVRLPDNNTFWLEKPYPACKSCGFYSLGFCRGGFFSNVE